LRFFTAGYLGHTVDELEAARLVGDCQIVDVRIRPLSRLPMWRQPAMIRYFGRNYLWCEDWGSPNFKLGAPLRLLDPDAGWELVKQVRRDVILLCACRDYESCHRKVLSEWLAERHDTFTQELEW
jgi:uncharacterized protein (DUF488 family)